MTFPERFSDLPEYAFPRLRGLLDAETPGAEPVLMSIGEPRHAFPPWVAEIMTEHGADFGRYPPNEGTPELRAAIADWLARRYGITLGERHDVLPLNGTREGIFNAMLALCPRGARALIPNPFYQAYAAGAAAAEARAHYVPATEESGHLPDFAALPAKVLDEAAVAWVCSPANPQGAVASREYWRDLIALAERHDFRILADECYSEIWWTDPPPGALEVAMELGADPERVMIVNSLSKRSNVPGLRSGFAAGGRQTIAALVRLRYYGGTPLPLPVQHASARLWADEVHVEASRRLYQKKYGIAEEILGDVAPMPAAGFFLWLPVGDGETAALRLWRESGVRVLPGAYLARDGDDGNPGRGFVRAAMVAEPAELRRGLEAIRTTLYE